MGVVEERSTAVIVEDVGVMMVVVVGRMDRRQASPMPEDQRVLDQPSPSCLSVWHNGAK